MSTFGERLRALRLAAGLSQQDLAGDDLSASYISLIEAGKRQPSSDVIRKLAERLRCTIQDLERGTVDSAEHRLVELEISYARLALGHGETESALERLASLLSRGGLTPAEDDQVRYVLALAHEKSGDLLGAARVLLPTYERGLTGQSAVPVSTISISMCRFYLDAGDLNAAARVAEGGLRAVKAQRLEGTDEHLRLAATLMMVYYELGDLLHCTAWAEQLLEVAKAHNAEAGQAAIYWNSAVVAEASGRLDEALHLCERALAIMTEQGTVRDLPRLRIEAAWFILRADPSRAREAASILDTCLPQLQDLGSPIDLATWESTRSLAHLLLNEPLHAEQLARHALLHLSAHPGAESARALITLGDALVAQGRRDEADLHYTAAGEALETTHPSRQVAAMWREIADRRALADHIDGALAAYRRALDASGIRSNLGAAEVAFGIAAPAPGGSVEGVPVEAPEVVRPRTTS